MSLNCGTLLDNSNYRVVKLLGKGSMGNVYLVERVKDDKKFVVKELIFTKALGIEEKTAREVFFREAGFMGKFEHTGIPKIHGVFAQDGKDYLVMDYYDIFNKNFFYCLESFWFNVFCGICRFLIFSCSTGSNTSDFNLDSGSIAFYMVRNSSFIRGVPVVYYPYKFKKRAGRNFSGTRSCYIFDLQRDLYNTCSEFFKFTSFGEACCM